MKYTLPTLPYDVLMCVLSLLSVTDLVSMAGVSSFLRRAVASGRFFEQHIDTSTPVHFRRLLLELFLLHGGDVSRRGVSPSVSQSIAFSVFSKRMLHMPLLSHLNADACRQMSHEFSMARAERVRMAREDVHFAVHSLDITARGVLPKEETEVCLEAIKRDDVEHVRLWYIYVRNSGPSFNTEQRFKNYALLSHSHNTIAYFNSRFGDAVFPLPDDRPISQFYDDLLQQRAKPRQGVKASLNRFAFLLGTISLSENKEDLAVLSRCAARMTFSEDFLGPVYACCSDAVISEIVPHIRVSARLGELLRLLIVRPRPPLDLVARVLSSHHYKRTENSKVLPLLAGLPHVDFIRAGVAHGFPVPRRITSFIKQLTVAPNREVSEYIVGTLYGGDVGTPTVSDLKLFVNSNLTNLFRVYMSALCCNWCPSANCYAILAIVMSVHNYYDSATYWFLFGGLVKPKSFLQAVVHFAIDSNHVDAIKQLVPCILKYRRDPLYVGNARPDINEAADFYLSIYQ